MDANETIIDLLRQIANDHHRPIEPTRCYSTEEAATALRVSSKSVHRMVESGMKYRAIIGRGYIFMGTDLLEFLKQQRRSAGDKAA